MDGEFGEHKRSVRGAALQSSPNVSSAFFCGSIDAQLKTGTNYLMATEQDLPQFLATFWFGVKRGQKYSKFEACYLLEFDSFRQRKRFLQGICTEIIFVKYNKQIQTTMMVNDRKQNFNSNKNYANYHNIRSDMNRF